MDLGMELIRHIYRLLLIVSIIQHTITSIHLVSDICFHSKTLKNLSNLFFFAGYIRSFAQLSCTKWMAGSVAIVLALNKGKRQYPNPWGSWLYWRATSMHCIVFRLKVLGKSVGLRKTSKREDQLYISLLVSVWRIICENFNPNGLILAEIWMKI